MSQHGTVLSEVLRQPGPTHSIFDVLAAACLVGPPVRDIALLGFGGGSVVAALRALGCQARIHAVDLDPTGLELLRNSGAPWLQPFEWHHADAVEWLQSAGHFDVILDDLSIPRDGEVEKPNASWDTLPALIARHLRPNGIALFNLLRPPGRGWTRGMADIASKLRNRLVIHLDDFENRILVSDRDQPRAPVQGLHPRTLGIAIRSHLRSLGSLQRKRVQIRVAPRPARPAQTGYRSSIR